MCFSHSISTISKFVIVDPRYFQSSILLRLVICSPFPEDLGEGISITSEVMVVLETSSPDLWRSSTLAGTMLTGRSSVC